MKLKFLGTGGGRYVTGEQRRRTAGIVVQTEELQVHIDPGPGALVYAHRELEDALETDAVIVSHAHLDHSNDAEAIIEMMAEAANKPAALFAGKTVLQGHGDIEHQVSGYHQELCRTVETLEDGTITEFQDLGIQSQEMFHSDPHTAGFILESGEKKIGFWTDSEHSDELAEFYQGCDTMVVYCGRPKNDGTPSHTSLDQVPDIAEASGCGTVIITHFGYKFLESDLEEQQNWLDERVDAKVVFAEDGMEFPGEANLDWFAS